MKLFIAIIVMLAALASAEYKVKNREDLIRFRNKCSEENKIPAEVLEQYKKWNFPDDTTTHSYLHCILVNFGLYDDEKGFNVENIHQQIVGGSHADHTDDSHVKIEKCTKEGSEAPLSKRCYTAFNCLIKEELNLVQKSVHAHDHDHSKH